MSITAFQRRRREIAKQNEVVHTAKQEDAINPLLEGLTVPQLKDIAKLVGVEKYSNLKRAELVKALEGWNLDGYHSGEESSTN